MTDYILHRAIETELARAREEGQELRGRIAEMEREVVRRGRELDAANRSLRTQWTREFDAANRELDAFSYSVAHELRGPLRSLDGFSQMLLAENAAELSEEGRRRLEIVRASAVRMSQLIDDLLRLAQLARGELRRMNFDLSSVVRTVALQIQESRRLGQAALTIEPGVQVYADPHLLQIVFENLLGNAWKFTSKKANALIEFGSREIEGEVCYFVRDNGAGFNMAYAPKLFCAFQRLHSESEFQGTGVGLATVKRIIARHGGRIWAEGEVEKGAVFYFTLGAPSRAE